MRQHVEQDTVFIDIGAWIGPISLYASRYALKTLALEPDPVAHRELAHNVRANSARVDVWNAGIDAEAGELTLYAPSDGLGQSTTSSFRSEGGGEAITVKTVTFDQIEAKLKASAPDDCRIAFKVDIEGHEYRIIDAIVAFARRHNAALHLSLHPRTYCDNQCRTVNLVSARLQTWRATSEIIRKLSSLGPVTFSSRGDPFAWSRLFVSVLMHRHIKNFSLEVATGKSASNLLASSAL